MKVAEKLQRQLFAAGIRKIFGIVGREASSILFDELADSIKLVLMRNELSVGVTACAVAGFTKTPQVCFVTLGPGATHIMTALATASLDRYPIVVIAAQLESCSIDYNNAHQCLDVVSMVKPLTKFAYELKSPFELRSAIDTAFTLSMTQPYGPSFISIPIDILESDIIDSDADGHSIFTKAAYETKQLDFKIQLNEIIQLLHRSEYPLIVAGDTVRKTEDGPSKIQALAESLNIPVVNTYSAKGVLPQNHPLNYGTINSYADVILEFPAISAIFNDSDFLLLIGYDLIEHYPKAWIEGRQKKVACLTPFLNNPSKAINPDVNAVCPLVEGLDYLMSHSKKIGKKEPYDISDLRVRIRELLQDTTEYAEGIMPNQVLYALDEYYKDYILASDIGMHRHVSALFYQARRPGDFVTSAGLSSFGTGLPLGIGAKLANPERNVVVFAGDGGFHSNSGELETVVRLGLKLLIIILNNESNGLIKRYQLTGKSRRTNPTATDFCNVDFVKIAEANGCYGIRAKSLSNLQKAIKDSMTLKTTTVIDVPVYYPNLYINPYAKCWIK